MIEYSLSEQTEIPPGGEFSVKVIGVGGAGANVLDRMALEGSDEADLLTLNTDVRALSTSVSTNKLQLGTTLLKGMGAGGDPELGRQSALEAIDDIRGAVRGYKMAFVCVGLGGGTGSGAAPEVCRVAKEEGVFLVVFATLPFSFEGKRRMDQALEALDRIGDYANAVVTFENDRMGELIVPKDGVQQAFAAADKIISQSIRATTGIVSHPGIIRIGMDELLSALDTKKSRCLFGFGQAKGDNRAHEALEQALKSPLLDKGKLLEDAKNVLIHVGGGDGMTLFEVELVMQELAKHIDEERTQILFGTGTDKSLGSSLTVTVISSLVGPDGDDRPPRRKRDEERDDADSGFSVPQSTSPLAGAVEALESEGEDPEPEAVVAAPEHSAVEELEEEVVTAEEEIPAVEEIFDEEIEEEPVAEEAPAVEEPAPPDGEEGELVEDEGELEAAEAADDESVDEEIETPVIEGVEEEGEALVEEIEEEEVVAQEEAEEVVEELVEEELAGAEAAADSDSESEQKTEAEVESAAVAGDESETESAAEIEGESETETAAEIEDESETETAAEIEGESETETAAEIEGESETETAAEIEDESEDAPAVEGESEPEEAPEAEAPVEPEVIPRKVVQSIPKRKPVIEAPKKRSGKLNITPVPPKVAPPTPDNSGAWSNLESPDSIGKLLQQGKQANEEDAEAGPETDYSSETVPVTPIPKTDYSAETVPVTPIPKTVPPKVSIRDLARKSREEAPESAPPEPAPEEPVEESVAELEKEEMIVAETEDAQKITLSRLVPGGKTVPKPEDDEPAVSPIDAGSQPLDLAGNEGGLEIDAVTAQQQQMLQLEPLSKGRFAKTEPTIVDGEDMDVPTFLRKRRK